MIYWINVVASQPVSTIHPVAGHLPPATTKSSIQPLGRQSAIQSIGSVNPVSASSSSQNQQRSLSTRDRIEQSIATIRGVKSVSEITTSIPILYVTNQGKLACRACINGDGFRIPGNIFNPRNGNRRQTFTTEWLNLRKNLKKHFCLASHLSNCQS